MGQVAAVNERLDALEAVALAYRDGGADGTVVGRRGNFPGRTELGSGAAMRAAILADDDPFLRPQVRGRGGGRSAGKPGIGLACVSPGLLLC